MDARSAGIGADGTAAPAIADAAAAAAAPAAAAAAATSEKIDVNGVGQYKGQPIFEVDMEEFAERSVINCAHGSLKVANVETEQRK